MKRSIFTLAAVLAFVFAKAQDAKFGVKGGLNLADITELEDSEMKIGFHVGGFVEIPLSDKFALQPELLYSLQGAKSEFSEDGISAEENIKLSYLNIPLMAKYFVNEKFSLEAGPQLGILLSAKDEYSVSGFGESESGEEDIKDMLQSTDFGVNFGAGYEFTENISAGVRYNLGLSQLQDSLEEGQKAAKNRVWQFSLAYKF